MIPAMPITMVRPRSLALNPKVRPLTPLLSVMTQLACTRIGAVHSVVFAGFSETNLASRIVDSKPKVAAPQRWLLFSPPRPPAGSDLPLAVSTRRCIRLW